jgi:hypothetical protein
VTLRELSDRDDKQTIYAEGLRALADAEVPFLVGGGYALYAYLGRWRTTKDIDVFLSAAVLDRALEALARAGFEVEVTDPAWLGKARKGGALIDVIFCSYNGLFPVDDSWHHNGRRAEVLGVPVRVVGPEEIIISKSFVAARDRFDGGDVSWLLRAVGRQLDWARIEQLMSEHWQVLLWQLIHFIYVFPAGKQMIPRTLLARLIRRLRADLLDDLDPPLVCRGPMLDPKLYRREIDACGDPRPRRDLTAPDREAALLADAAPEDA